MHGRQRVHGLGSRVAVGIRRRLGEGASCPRVVGRVSPGSGRRVAELGVLDGREGHGGAHGRQAWLLVLHASVVVVARRRRVLRFLPRVPRGRETASTSIVCHDPIANWRNGRQGGSCAAVILGFFPLGLLGRRWLRARLHFSPGFTKPGEVDSDGYGATLRWACVAFDVCQTVRNGERETGRVRPRDRRRTALDF